LSLGPDSAAGYLPNNHLQCFLATIALWDCVVLPDEWTEGAPIKFQRRVSPRLAVGSTPALQLSATVVYEVLANSSPNKFDVVGLSGGLITTASDAAMPRNHESVLSGFFDMDAIKQLCRYHNIEFGNK